MTTALSIGIFVGGAGLRMGGVAKGLLRVPDGSETLIERLLRVCRQAAPEAKLRLIGGASQYAEFYAHLGLSALSDDPPQVGPVGGLRALLLQACSEQSQCALALACDLPFLDEIVISTLLRPLEKAARVPYVAGRLQPLAAAYAPGSALAAVDRSLALGKHALMHVLDQLGNDVERVEFEQAQELALRDWDTPEDMRR